MITYLAITTTSPVRRAIISITSAQATLFQGKETTCFFISEALHPYNVFTAAGFEVDLVSETGTYTADWPSQQPDFLNDDDLGTWNDTNSDFRQKPDDVTRAADIDGSKYGVLWGNGGIVASVCQGPAIFANSREITGFTTEAECPMGIIADLKSGNKELVEVWPVGSGPNTRSAGIWDDYHVVDGRLVTGQNPASARSTAEAVVVAFEKL
ncbi:class I glutamine amidotransferase-like protein [Xylariales sp. AK1849]|nr:class I glutamine amidotransferase-like protein [Xylariales sp. AK1849]